MYSPFSCFTLNEDFTFLDISLKYKSLTPNLKPNIESPINESYESLIAIYLTLCSKKNSSIYLPVPYISRPNLDKSFVITQFISPFSISCIISVNPGLSKLPPE